MFRAMMWKEWRQIQGITLIALAAYAMLIVSTTMPSATNGMILFEMFRSGNEAPDIPFILDSFPWYYLCISIALAIALGLKQTLGESVSGTYLFLLHRPASHRWIMATKLFTGLATYLVCAAAPILVYGWWAATHTMLFEWSMTLPCWTYWFAMAVLYLSAFLTGVRPGRWYVSRLFPLLAAAAPVLLAVATVNEHRQGFAGHLWLCAALLLIDVWVMVTILFVARTRDFS
jgi:hypothetical protein